MEAFDEKLIVSGLIGDFRGACSHTGCGPRQKAPSRLASRYTP
jgi:hypothetical protein